MSTLIDEGLDTDSLTLLGLDWSFAIPCDSVDENGEPDCDNPAEWKIQISCCGHVFFFCDLDKNHQLDAMEHAAYVTHLPPAPGACGSQNVRVLSVERL